MNELALFAGAGGGLLGTHRLLGWTPVCAVEIAPYPRSVLLARQRDGFLPRFPIWDDITTFDGRPWRGSVDVVSGGFPCQDISCVGKKAGIRGKQSGLWAEFARIIGEVQPACILMENVAAITVRGIDVTLGDFSCLGYDATWGTISAADAIWLGGIPLYDHLRNRFWCIPKIPNTNKARFSQLQGQSKHAEPPGKGLFNTCDWWKSEPGMGRVVNGVANRVDRLKALGEGQVPAVVALAWNILQK